MKNCPNCAYAIFDNSLRACPRCGYALSAESPTTANPYAQPQIPPTRALSPEGGYSQTRPSDARAAPAWPVATAQSQVKKRSPILIWGLVALAVLVLAAGAGGIAYVAGHGNGLPGGAHGLAQTTATATDTPQPTATAMVTPRPTATPKPTATATPVPQLVTIFKDPLTTGSHDAGWYTDGGSVYFQSDGYHVGNGYECYAPIGSLTDFKFSVQVKQANGGSTQGLGIIFRAIANTPKEYVFAITSGGHFYAFNRAGNFLIQPTPSTVIHQGLNAINTLEVDARGSHFDFFINGARVGSADDGMRASGQIGFMTEQAGEAAVFSNITVAKWA